MTIASPRVLFARLQTPQPWMQSAPRVEAALEHWPRGRCMGVFMGLFGMSNHELFVLLSIGPEGPDNAATLRQHLDDCLTDSATVTETIFMRSTVRPQTDTPFTRAGIHVFRFFTLPFSKMDDAVAFSSAGWETFERDDDPEAGEGYRTEPMGLFAQEPFNIQTETTHQAQGRLLLVTWYDSMTSWERSRSPNPQATAQFKQRAALASSIVAYATRLAGTA